MSGFTEMAEPVADKSHRCVHCVERIAPGTKHIKVSGIFEYDWFSWRAHRECIAAMDRGIRMGYDDEMLCPSRHARGLSCYEMELLRGLRNL